MYLGASVAISQDVAVAVYEAIEWGVDVAIDFGVAVVYVGAVTINEAME